MRDINFLYYRTMLEWMRLYANGKSIKKQLIAKDINKFMLYGATEIADVFVRKCIREGVFISGIVDRKIYRTGWDYCGIPLLPKYVLSEMVDCVVIVTAVGHYDEILEELRVYPDIKVISMLDFMTGL